MKERLDILLFNKGLAPSRQKAQAMIMEGIVFVDGQREDKSGSKFDENALIEVHGKIMPYVSRGGYKLEKAIEVFHVDPRDKICIDIGASTGGFTDCMLQNGAKKVYSIDVGYGQLDYKLRVDKRVICMEKTNIRYVKQEDLDDSPELGSIDVSFISLKLVLPVAKDLLSENGEIVCLIKPQFEAGKEKVGKKGVVRDALVHKEVLDDIIGFALGEGWSLLGLDFSPIKGPEGNIEYLMYISKVASDRSADTCVSELIRQTVDRAHNSL